ncbi:hypothetical protein [Flammeovirga kamogawensis]|uniref:50S ribosomal protein L7/L12 n=1 Tax=Flammeovirga kamogawensis TaxID=373891 RepID=A0ABX8GXC0_9BACT|nr:hypothetical protein [Flammeovirga kamogawensis]MBB6460890.1 hypothetical protein [Flammeovirga kamogawensis]QWG08235.1 hypothetical protein KM029_04670 [Flammeovirga kamogawensis]TRX70038.1 hypothetical protein EO216_18605 [Flammeovirga kamogawensis]
MKQFLISIEDDKNANLVKELLKDLSFVKSINEIKSSATSNSSEITEGTLKTQMIAFKAEHKNLNINIEFKD